MNTFSITASLLLLIIFASLHRNKRAKNKIVRVIDNNCTGCRRCIKRCGHKALDMVSDKTGVHIAVKFPEKCTACGDCVSVCKFNALEISSRKQSE